MEYNCPLCQSVLREQVGSSIHPGDPKYGIGLDCTNMACPAQEVAGHGNNAKEAFEVIKDKFKVRT